MKDSFPKKVLSTVLCVVFLFLGLFALRSLVSLKKIENDLFSQQPATNPAPITPVTPASSSTSSSQAAPERFRSTGDPFVHRSGGGLREETETFTLGYDNQPDKEQQTRVLELTVLPVPAEKSSGGEEKNKNPPTSASEVWTQWIFYRGNYAHSWSCQKMKPEDVLYVQLQYHNGEISQVFEDGPKKHIMLNRPTVGMRFYNPNSKPVVVVSRMINP